jgi:glycine cleavage system regulatory protein
MRRARHKGSTATAIEPFLFWAQGRTLYCGNEERPMSESMVLTLIGPDRPGLVDALSTTIAEHDGNWLESRMSRLAGKFAGILRLTVPEDRAGSLREELGRMQKLGLTVVIEGTAADLAPSSARNLTLELLGRDHPGIVRGISHALAGRGINIVALETASESAPMSGETLFRASAELGLPASLDSEDLRQTLEELAGDLMVDISLNEP